jgi:phage/plasmid-associated DNA primase
MSTTNSPVHKRRHSESYESSDQSSDDEGKGTDHEHPTRTPTKRRNRITEPANNRKEEKSDDPITRDDDPITTDDDPITTDDDPITSDDEPISDDGDDEPISEDDDDEPIIDDGEPITDDDEPMTNDVDDDIISWEPALTLSIGDAAYEEAYLRVFGSDRGSLSQVEWLTACRPEYKIYTSTARDAVDKSTKWLDLMGCAKRTEWEFDGRVEVTQSYWKRKVVIAMETDDGKRAYTELTIGQLAQMQNPQQMLMHYEGPRVISRNHAYLLPDCPMHLPFDFEVKPENASKRRLLQRIEDAGREAFEAQVLARLDSFFIKKFGRSMRIHDIQWLEASVSDLKRDESGEHYHGLVKASRHLHVISEGFKSLAHVRRFVIAWTIDLEGTCMGEEDLLVERDDNGQWIHATDLLIYGSGKQPKTLRMVGSGKVDTVHSRVLRPTKLKSRGDDATQYLVRSMPNYSINMKSDQELLEFDPNSEEELEKKFPLAIPDENTQNEQQFSKLTSAQLRGLVMALNKARANKRDERNKVIWAIQACGGTQELAVEFYKQRSNDYTDAEAAVDRHWKEGEKHTSVKRPNAGSLCNWVKQDIGEAPYKQLRKKLGMNKKPAGAVQPEQRAQLLEVSEKHGILSEIVSKIDKAIVTNWDPTLKAFIQADATKDHLIQLTEGTPGATRVEPCWEDYSKYAPRKVEPLMAVLKDQKWDSVKIDTCKMRLKAADKAVAAAIKAADKAAKQVAKVENTDADTEAHRRRPAGEDMLYPLTPAEIQKCIDVMQEGRAGTGSMAEAFYLATRNNIEFDVKTGQIVEWGDEARLWIRHHRSVIKAVLTKVLRPFLRSVSFYGDDKAEKKAWEHLEEASKHSAIIDSFMAHLKKRTKKPMIFNRIPHLYPLRGGYVLDFKKREKRLRTREDCFTFETRVDFLGEDADLSRATTFTDEIMCHNVKMTKFLQRRLGYMLSGETGIRAMDIWTGTGTNGKTILEKAMARLMEASDGSAGFFCKLGSDYFILKKKAKGAATTESNGLFEARAGFSSEPSRGQGKIDAEGIKGGVGGEKKVLRFNYGEEMAVELMAKFVLILNDMIDVDPEVKAFWNKIFVIPFLAKFEETDETMAYCTAFVNDQEANDQLFTWIAMGMFENYTADGKLCKPHVPDLVEQQKAKYRTEANPFEKFVADTLCVFDKPATIDKNHEYYKNYIMKTAAKTKVIVKVIQHKNEKIDEEPPSMVGLYYSWCDEHNIHTLQRLNQADLLKMANAMFETYQITGGKDKGLRPFIGVRVKLPQDNDKEMMAEFIQNIALDDANKAEDHNKTIAAATLYRAYQKYCKGSKGLTEPFPEPIDRVVKKQLSMEAFFNELDKKFAKEKGEYKGVTLPVWLID